METRDAYLAAAPMYAVTLVALTAWIAKLNAKPPVAAAAAATILAIIYAVVRGYTRHPLAQAMLDYSLVGAVIASPSILDHGLVQAMLPLHAILSHTVRHPGYTYEAHVVVLDTGQAAAIALAARLASRLLKRKHKRAR